MPKLDSLHALAHFHIFLHAKPWIPGGEKYPPLTQFGQTNLVNWILQPPLKPICTVVIHQWRSPLHQFARARTIDEYDITMPVTRFHMTSQIELWQSIIVLAGLCARSEHEIARKNKIRCGFPWILIFCLEWGDSVMIFTSDEVTREYNCRIARLVTKIDIHGNPYIILYLTCRDFCCEFYRKLSRTDSTLGLCHNMV